MLSFIRKIFVRMNYSGDINPSEAFSALKQEKDSYLIDVRTIAEWSFVGLPDLSEIGKNVICLSWLTYPTMSVNSNFAEQLAAEIPDKGAKLFFLCKVGGRSLDAAI